MIWNVGTMKMTDYRGMIGTNAARLRELNAGIERTFKARPHGTAHSVACAAFHSEFGALAFPGGVGVSLARLETGDRS